MSRIASKRALEKHYNARTAEVKQYFGHVPTLLSNNIPMEICLAYVFLKTEQAQNRILYGGVTKLHRGESKFVARVMNFQHLTRDGFLTLYKNVFGNPLKKSMSSKLDEAAKTRDRVVHGKKVTDSELRDAIADVLEYAELINSELHSIAQFKPFGSMKGFKGRGTNQDVRTTKWIMRGLGFGVRV